MSQPGGGSLHSKKFIFKEEDVALREELQLTEAQRFAVRQLFTSDWKFAFIDVLPTTTIVHREVAEKKFGVRRCVFVTGPNPDNISVFAAPRFCCRKPVDRARNCPLYNAYVNMEKCDLHVLTSIDTAPPMPTDFDKRVCFICGKRGNESLESTLFSLHCGHLTCRSCWLKHCKWALAREFGTIPCTFGDCNEQLTISRAATLLGDKTIAVMVDHEWRRLLRQSDNLKCAGCKHWMKRHKNFYRKVMTAGCACGCYTCVRCGQRDHTPLRCKDAAVWSEIRSKENEDETAAEAEKSWSLTREDFDACLGPEKEIASETFKKNLRFMRTNDHVHGKMLEKVIPTVARMLEMRRVQQLAKRSELHQADDTYYGEMDPNQIWANLEEFFYSALDTLGETKLKAVYLHRTMEGVLYHYNF